MTYVVTENRIRCTYTDCVAVCPVDCVSVGETMLVIDPAACIDCGVCEPECPADAIKADTEPGMDGWRAFNAKYAALWPNIAEKTDPAADAAAWDGRDGKLRDAFGAADPALA